MSMISRRKLIKNSSYILASGLFLGVTGCFDKGKKGEAGTSNTTTTKAPEATAQAGSGDPLISLDHPTAKSLKYVHDATQAERPDKPGTKGSEQLCSNCQFYKPVEGKNYGTCQLIPVKGKHVAEKGWCLTWAKKA